MPATIRNPYADRPLADGDLAAWEHEAQRVYDRYQARGRPRSPARAAAVALRRASRILHLAAEVRRLRAKADQDSREHLALAARVERVRAALEGHHDEPDAELEALTAENEALRRQRDERDADEARAVAAILGIGPEPAPGRTPDGQTGA
jgi:hypothetical protein